MPEQQAQDADAITEDAQDASSADQPADQSQDDRSNDFGTLPEWAQNEIESLRKRSATYRTRAREHEAASQKLKQLEDAAKSDLERLQGERDELSTRVKDLEARYRDSVAESAFIDAATKANARSPRTLFRAYKGDIDFDDDGVPTNVAALVKKLQKDEPELFRQETGSANGGAKGEKAGDQSNITSLIRHASGRS